MCLCVCVCVCVCERERERGGGGRLSTVTVILEAGNIYRYDSLLKKIKLKMVHNVCPDMSSLNSAKVLK
jgi:hypothetical protein